MPLEPRMGFRRVSVCNAASLNLVCSPASPEAAVPESAAEARAADAAASLPKQDASKEEAQRWLVYQGSVNREHFTFDAM